MIEDESSGHKDLIKFLEFFIHSFNKPSLIFVDEFNSSFHTKLSKQLVELFNKNSLNSQFVFITQDTSLMDSDYLCKC